MPVGNGTGGPLPRGQFVKRRQQSWRWTITAVFVRIEVGRPRAPLPLHRFRNPLTDGGGAWTVGPFAANVGNHGAIGGAVAIRRSANRLAFSAAIISPRIRSPSMVIRCEWFYLLADSLVAPHTTTVRG